MRSIARSLNTIALAINNLAKALGPPKEQVVTLPALGNNTSSPRNSIAKNVTITSLYQGKNYNKDNQQSPKIAHIHQQEKLALDAVYNALTDKGNHPDHHDHIMRELSTKWPVLHNALKQLVIARKETYNSPSLNTEIIHNSSKTDSKKKIW